MIRAVVSDPSGIDRESIIFKLDNSSVNHAFNAATGEISYTPLENLTEDTHTVMLSVADSVGNRTTVHWSFTVRLTSDPGNPGSGGSSSITPIAKETCLTMEVGKNSYSAFNGAVTMEIPAGTFPSGTTIIVRELPGQALLSTVYEIETGGVLPKQPVVSHCTLR